MLFDFGEEKLEIVHEEPQENWENIEIEINEDCMRKLYVIEDELYKYGLTLNDFFIAVIKNEIKKHSKE